MDIFKKEEIHMKKKTKTTDVISQGAIERKILLIRGNKVLLDRDLAILYGVKAIRLREQVKRNKKRFPEDFMFQLTTKEVEILVSQNAIPSQKHLGGYLPYAFTEQGIAMLSSVLHTQRAIEVNIAIMRVFVKIKRFLHANKELAHKLGELEKKVEKHEDDIQTIFDAI